MAQESLSLSTPLAQRLERLGLEFLAGFYAAETHRYPENVEALAELGHAYTLLERFEDGLAVDRQLVRLVPENPTAHYNLACSLALVGHTVEALDALEGAIARGYDDAPHMLADRDLESLRGETRFQELAARLA